MPRIKRLQLLRTVLGFEKMTGLCPSHLGRGINYYFLIVFVYCWLC